jgi:hypothetical protein
MDQDQAREGYHAALQLVSNGAKTIWDSFRSLLLANTVLIGLAGATLKLYPQFHGLVLILGILGLVVCVTWALITARHFDYYKYSYAWARKYEEVALGSGDHIVQMGKSFAEGSSVAPPGIGPTRMRWASRLFRIEYLMYVVVIAFVIVYGYLLKAA